MIRTFSDTPGEFSVMASEADSIEAVANGRAKGMPAEVLTEHLRQGFRKAQATTGVIQFGFRSVILCSHSPSKGFRSE
jgi:hypothetical protein